MMPRIFRSAREDDVLIVTVLCSVGSLADADILDEMESLLGELRQPGLRGAVIDFAKAGYFGSSLLEALRMLWNQVCGFGGCMTLCNVSEVGREVLEISRFDTIWPIYSSCDEARQAVQRHDRAETV